MRVFTYVEAFDDFVDLSLGEQVLGRLSLELGADTTSRYLAQEVGASQG